MKKINLLFLFVLFFSCSDKKRTKDIISEKILLFDKFQNSHYKNMRINILRIAKNTKQFEYELRKKDIAGYAVFQTNPSTIIFKNIYSSPIDTGFVQGIKEFNEGKNIVLLLMENYSDGTKLVFRVYEEKIILYKGDLFKTNYLKNSDSVFQINEKWNYVIKPFIGER